MFFIFLPTSTFRTYPLAPAGSVWRSTRHTGAYKAWQSNTKMAMANGENIVKNGSSMDWFKGKS